MSVVTYKSRNYLVGRSNEGFLKHYVVKMVGDLWGIRLLHSYVTVFCEIAFPKLF